jgi:hypothetical protein
MSRRVRFGVDVGQYVEGFEDPADVGQGQAELGGVAAALEHAHHVGGRHRPVVHGADDAQDVGPVPPDPRQVDPARAAVFNGA